MKLRSTLRYPAVGNFLFIYLPMFLAMSCDKEESFPIEPRIEFVDVKFIDVNDPTFYEPDTLKLTFEYTDGDADLGYDNDQDVPAERFYFKLNDPTRYESYSISNQTHQYVNYKAKRTNPNYDTLPSFDKPFTCTNWEIVYKFINGDYKTIDTLYFKPNSDFFNLKVKFMVEQADGSFSEFDFMEEFCFTYDGIIRTGSYGPIDVKRYSSKHGQLTYNMSSIGFKYLFGTKKIKLIVYVHDRALHKSNVIETPVFTFQ